MFDDCEPLARKLLVFRNSISWVGGVPTAVHGAVEPITIQSGEPLALECRHFLDCVKYGKQPITNCGEGVRVISILSRIEEEIQQPNRLTHSPGHSGLNLSLNDSLPYQVAPKRIHTERTGLAPERASAKNGYALRTPPGSDIENNAASQHDLIESITKAVLPIPLTDLESRQWCIRGRNVVPSRLIAIHQLDLSSNAPPLRSKLTSHPQSFPRETAHLSRSPAGQKSCSLVAPRASSARKVKDHRKAQHYAG